MTATGLSEAHGSSQDPAPDALPAASAPAPARRAEGTLSIEASNSVRARERAGTPSLDGTTPWTPCIEFPCSLWLTRHGETPWNAEGRLQGRSNNPLGAVGHGQIVELAARLRGKLAPGPLPLFVSPLRRTRESADILAAELEPAGFTLCLQPLDGLAEFDLGRFTSATLAELQSDPDWLAYLEHPLAARFPGGESIAEVVQRVQQSVETILANALTRTAGRAIVVSHGGVLRCLAAAVLGLGEPGFKRLHIDNAALLLLRCRPPSTLRLSLG